MMPADTADASIEQDRNAGRPLHLHGRYGATRCELPYGSGIRTTAFSPAMILDGYVGSGDVCPLCMDTLEPEQRLIGALHQAIETARDAAVDELDGCPVTPDTEAANRGRPPGAGRR